MFKRIPDLNTKISAAQTKTNLVFSFVKIYININSYLFTLFEILAGGNGDFFTQRGKTDWLPQGHIHLLQYVPTSFGRTKN